MVHWFSLRFGFSGKPRSRALAGRFHIRNRHLPDACGDLRGRTRYRSCYCTSRSDIGSVNIARRLACSHTLLPQAVLDSLAPTPRYRE